MAEPLVLLALAALIIVLIALTVRLGRHDFTHLADRMAARTRAGFEVLKPCPLCGTMLRRGETVRSEVFSGGNVPKPASGRPADYLAHIHGCPYCYPSNPDHPRICPVCSATLGPKDYLVARMFARSQIGAGSTPGTRPPAGLPTQARRSEARTHVHVLGCSRCRLG